MNEHRTGFPIVGIGASAGGLEALRDLLEGFAGDTGMALIVIQHLDPHQDSMMAELIDRYTEMKVTQIAGGEVVEPGHVYVIPPGQGLSIDHGQLSLRDFVEPRGLRRPIDDFFEALGADQGRLSAGVILSGTGADGSRGIRAIKENGGLAVAQDPSEARYNGMPLTAAGTGFVDFVRPAREILSVLADYFQREEGPGGADSPREVVDIVDDLCIAIQAATGHDFSGYKRSTLARRILRRMNVLGVEDRNVYVDRVRRDEGECLTLFRDLLINVTRFFRDPDTFATLRNTVIDPLIRAATDGDEIRIWVPGCSSGEEAYSIAMLLHDATSRFSRLPVINVFASDIDEQMLDIARQGRYPRAALADIPEPFRTRYTSSAGDRFSVVPKIRDMVRFSLHSVIKDPPFSRVDLVSCRNMLIYLDEDLQRAVLPLFHYALRPGGHLFLGPSESIGRFDDLFEDLNHRHRLFRRRPVAPRYPLELPAAISRPVPTPVSRRTQEAPVAEWLETEALNQMTARYAPATLLVDPVGAILASWGPVGRYFDFPSEQERRPYAPTLAKPGLREVLAPLLRQTGEDNRPRIARDVAVKADFGVQGVRVICEPVRDGAMLVVIEETGGFQASREGEFVDLEEGESQVQMMETELRVMRHRLRSTIEELETANEELKSSNEEMMSMNEELQSTNEELSTVNDELKSRLDQLTVANADLRNFLESTQLAVVVVDESMRVRSFTDAATAIFPLQLSDRGRDLAEVSSPLGARYIDLARRVAQTGEAVEDRLRDGTSGRDYAVRILPYSKLDGSQDGATLIFTDITDALTLERDLEDERERLALAIEVAGIGIWEYDPAAGTVELDRTEQALFGLVGTPTTDIDTTLRNVHEDDRQNIDRALRAVVANQQDFNESFRLRTDDGQTRWLRGLGRFARRDGEARVMGVNFDVTSERTLLAERELHLAEMNHRIKNLFAVVGAMVSSVERESTDAQAFSRNLRGRISALDRAHALMLRDDMRAPIPLQQLVERILEPTRGGQQIEVSGPDTLVPVRELTPMVLILHEWTTNSAKYGAMSQPDGELTINWGTEDGVLCLNWDETVKDFGEHGAHAGFGSRLVQASIMQLRAALDRDTSDSRLTYRLCLPTFDTDSARA
ncbi:MAG: CheR family methyltransferase [Pararhodobacter sp.]